jgi:CysZ protein
MKLAMLKEIIISIQSYAEAHRLIQRHKLWKWILIPGFFYTLLFLFGFYLFWSSSNAAISWMFNQFGVKKWIDQMQESWLSFFFLIGNVFIQLFLLIFYFSLFKFISLIIGAPLFSYLSEKTQSILAEKEFHFHWQLLWTDLWRGVRIAVRNISWQTVYMVALFFLSLIPIVGWVTPLIGLFIDCYYMGFSMLDYSSERNQLNENTSIQLIGRHKGLAIGNGMIFYMFHAIPLLGWLLAPGYAVIAATISMHKAKEQQILTI